MKRTATVLASVIAALLLSAGVASAQQAGVWRAYGNTNPITSSSSTWHCTSTQSIATNVAAQACAVRSAYGSSVQGAVIIRNNRSTLYEVGALTDLYNTSGTYLG
ncbi:MAG: hypothetical protein M3422_21505, partial [Actinomycetota bacterium]|nr:hypothetical protein [Actinomycetota bacterium]